MACAIEALGMALPGSSSTPADDPAKLDECRRAGPAIRLLLERDLKPRDIMTRPAFENAMVGPSGAPPTPCCTCWRWRGRLACRWRSTTSRP
jgi:dihydroxyacid dehydratase/phosphogluconate dehydratase